MVILGHNHQGAAGWGGAEMRPALHVGAPATYGLGHAILSKQIVQSTFMVLAV